MSDKALEVTFRAKVGETDFRSQPDGSITSRPCVTVPRLTSKHVDLGEARRHPKFGSYANSTLLEGVLNRAAKAHGVERILMLDELPECASVDTSGFLATVKLQFTGWKVAA